MTDHVHTYVYGSNCFDTAVDCLTAAVLDATQCTVGRAQSRSLSFTFFLSTF
jgi:hypothetical protein